jgi:membrane-associated phospholipid phosphatase
MRCPGARDVLGLALGGAVLIGTSQLARRGVSESEVRIFRRANGLPDEAFPGIWLPMQFGTFGTVPVLAGFALVRRRVKLATAIVAGGTAAWVFAKVVKPAVGRRRPAGILADVQIRGKEEGDLGFPSGHAAVSAALTLVIWRSSASGWRMAGAALSGFVPFARMYVGAHLPLDVLGGSALGLAVGCLTNLTFQSSLAASSAADMPVERVRTMSFRPPGGLSK